VREHLPHAVHVFDHFHVVKLYNDKLSALRRDLYRELSDQGQRQLLKGTRWLLLKNPENLDPSRNERQRLQDALRLNTPLTLAYYLKEDLRQIWQQRDKPTARLVLRDWIRRAKASRIPMLQQFARTMGDHPGLTHQKLSDLPKPRSTSSKKSVSQPACCRLLRMLPLPG